MKNYTVKEVSRIIDVNEVTVKRRIKDGSLRAYTTENGKYIISEEDFNTFLETHPRYSKIAKSNQPATHDAVVDVISANEAFNTYAVFLKKLMMLPKEDINSILPIVENHKSLLDFCINELKKKSKQKAFIERR